MKFNPIIHTVLDKITYHTKRNKTDILTKLSDHNKFYTKNNTELTKFYTNCLNSQDFGCFTSSNRVAKCYESKNCDFGATWIGESEDSYKMQLMTKTGEFYSKKDI